MPIEENFIPNQDGNTDQEIKGLIEALFSSDGSTQKTVLSTRQVIALARAHAFAKMFNIPDLTLLCEYLQQLKISEGGRGRKDLVAALQSRKPKIDDEMMRQRRRLMG